MTTNGNAVRADVAALDTAEGSAAVVCLERLQLSEAVRTASPGDVVHRGIFPSSGR